MNKPTDAEIIALMRDGYYCRYNDEADHIDFARADQVLAMERVPLTDAQIKGLIEEGVFFGNCKEIVRAIEAAHGIKKGGQHGTE